MYVSNGILRKKRPCGLWLIPALMWSIFNLMGLFFQTMPESVNRKVDDPNKQKY